jgi:hypothetical protein
MSEQVTPIMAGGTGRSGTTVIAGLLHRHAHVRASWPREVKFVNSAGGLLDLTIGPTGRWAKLPWGKWAANRERALQTRFRAFETGMRNEWWLRTNRHGRASGLHLSWEAAERDLLLEQLSAGLVADPIGAGRAFLAGMIRSQHGAAGEPWWIDTSPPNISNAGRIHQFWPETRFIWMVRDGRSTAASVLAERWGPSDPVEAINWWANRVRRAHLGLHQVPSQAVLVLSLEDLVVYDRAASYQRVLDFLALEDDPAMRAFFNERMPAERVGLDKWRSRVKDPSAFAEAYRVAAEQLESSGFEVFAR